MLKRYSSYEAALRAIYPEFQWESARFVEYGKVPNGFWREKDNVLKALDWAENRLGITKVILSLSLSLSLSLYADILCY